MPDDDRFRPDPDDGEDEERQDPELNDGEIPASVTFMEMMRQAAARQRPQSSFQADSELPARIAGRRLFSAANSGQPPEMPPDTPEFDEEFDPDDATEPAPPPRGSSRQDAMEDQRVQRVKRRSTRRRRKAVGVFGGLLRSTIVVSVAAVLLATIFTWSTPSGFIQSGVRQELSLAIATSVVTAQPTALPTPNWLRRIGVVSGHRGPENDPGAVCPDGLTEAEINFNVAQLVVRNLRARGYTVDLLDEFDPRLDGYQAAALLSIHANTCQEWPGEIVSGYLVAAAAARITARGNDLLLVDCISRHYQTATSLQRRDGVTADMTDYHTFREINSLTPAAIVELGFLLADRDILTNQPDALARGLTDGILCFMEPGLQPTVAPTPEGQPSV